MSIFRIILNYKNSICFCNLVSFGNSEFALSNTLKLIALSWSLPNQNIEI